MTLQRAYGLFPRIMGKGDAAKVISDLLDDINLLVVDWQYNDD